MHAERSEIMWGTTKIPYEVRRSPRRATVSLTVEPGIGLVVTAPDRASISNLDAVVKSRARWVVEHIRRASDVPPPLPTREFVSGESFTYLGRQYRLRLLPPVSVRPLALRRGWLEVPMPRGLDHQYHSAYARAALTDWYKRRALTSLPRWVARYIDRLNVEPPQVVVSEQTKRWGSCAKGVLRLNWRIIQAPKSIVEYVLAHEAVHLVHQHHGRAFWAALGRMMPDYETRKARLRRLGPTLVW